MRYVVLLIVGLSIAGAGPSARADQNSPALDDLFSQLQSEINEPAAVEIERRIWRLWGLPRNRKASTPFAEGVVYMSQGVLDRARAKFDQVVATDPGFAEGWNKRATVAYLQGDMASSVRDIQKTIELEPRHFGALSGLALIYEGMGREETALDVLIQVKEIYPGMPGIDERMSTLQDAIDAKGT